MVVLNARHLTNLMDELSVLLLNKLVGSFADAIILDEILLQFGRLVPVGSLDGDILFVTVIEAGESVDKYVLADSREHEGSECPDKNKTCERRPGYGYAAERCSL